MSSIPSITAPSSATSGASSGNINNSGSVPPFPFAGGGQNSQLFILGLIALGGVYLWKKL